MSQETAIHYRNSPAVPLLTRTERRYLSPLRYPGGKAKLAGFIKYLLVVNDMVGGHYVEPYAGGASVALSLLFDGCVSQIHINDFDSSVYAFWHSVLFETDSLCRMIRNKRVTAAEWLRQRAIQDAPEDHSLLERGFSTFFLNRTNRSGIICSGGMIGGSRQLGKWKLDARYNKVDLVKRIERISLWKDRISLYGFDAAKVIREILPALPSPTFVYLDPPYYIKGGRRLYANYYDYSDHLEIRNLLSSAPPSWLVTYDDAPEIRQMYRAFRRRQYVLRYTARDRYTGSEMMIFGNGLKIPSRSTIMRLVGG